jgi:hypothetical protein
MAGAVVDVDAGGLTAVDGVACGNAAGTVVTPVEWLLKVVPTKVEGFVDAEEQAPATRATSIKDAMKATKRLPSRRGWEPICTS